MWSDSPPCDKGPLFDLLPQAQETDRDLRELRKRAATLRKGGVQTLPRLGISQAALEVIALGR